MCVYLIITTSASYSAATVRSIVLSFTLDCHRPYYLHPSDSPGMQITAFVLNENNYYQWQRSMKIALSSKLKLGFVDGLYVKPASCSSLLVHWLRCNNMVMSWILNFVSVDIRNIIVYIKNAHKIWLDLAVHYAQSNVPKLFHLCKELAHLSQGSISFSYYTKFRTLNDMLECFVSKPRCGRTLCTCAINEKLDELDVTPQLRQLLKGLNDTFISTRGQILMMQPLPTLNQSYATLLQEESQ